MQFDGKTEGNYEIPPLWKELSEFILKSSDQNWLIFKIANWIEKEWITNKITEYFDMINYTPEFAFSESDLWFLISKNIRNGDFIYFFSNERRKLPESVERFYKSNNQEVLLKFYYLWRGLDNFTKEIKFKLEGMINNHIKSMASLIKNQRNQEKTVSKSVLGFSEHKELKNEWMGNLEICLA